MNQSQKHPGEMAGDLQNEVSSRLLFIPNAGSEADVLAKRNALRKLRLLLVCPQRQWFPASVVPHPFSAWQGYIPKKRVLRPDDKKEKC